MTDTLWPKIFYRRRGRRWIYSFEDATWDTEVLYSAPPDAPESQVRQLLKEMFARHENELVRVQDEMEREDND